MVYILKGDITPAIKCSFCNRYALPKKSLVRKQMTPLPNGKMVIQTFIKCQNCITEGVLWPSKKA